MNLSNHWIHVQGYLFKSEALKLQQLAKDKNVLEIGSYLGRSSCAMAATAESVTCVDHFSGSPKDLENIDPGSTKKKFLKNIQPFNNIELIESSANDFFDSSTPSDYDFIFYDADHREEPVATFIRWLLVYRYDKTIAIHDYGKKDFPGTKIAVDPLLENRDYNKTGSLIWVNMSSV